MNLFRTLPVKIKLPLIIVGLCLVTGVTLQVVNTLNFRDQTRNLLQDQFVELADGRAKAIENLILGNETNLQLLGESPAVNAALDALGSSYRLLAEPTGTLQRAYIDSNPNPAGKRQDLDLAAGPEAYHQQHATIHPFFRKVLEKRRLYDLFLFDAEMNNIYSVFKENDFAASFKSGPLAESGLGRALRQAAQAEAGTVIFSDFSPYEPSQGAYAAFVVTKVASRAGLTAGYIAFQLNFDDLVAILDDRTGLGETGTTYMVGLAAGADHRGDYIIGSGMANRVAGAEAGVVGLLDPAKITPQIAAVAAGQSGFFEDVLLADGQVGFADTAFIEFNGAKWGLVVERDADDIFAALNALIFEMVLIGSGIAVVAVVVGIFFSRSITKPLARISSAVDSIANGNLQVEVVDADRGDELGMIANSLHGLLDKLTLAKLAEEERDKMQTDLRVVVETLRAGMKDLAGGDLSRPIDAEFAAEYEGLRNDFNGTLATLSTTITQVVDAAHSIRARSTEISTASEDLSRRTENQAAALEETAAALDELTVSVKSAADSAREVESIVRQARKDAEDSGIVVQGAVAAMAEIEKSSEQISQIIGAIDDIAFQTNLLALNAGVEAARAGDAGKGFAVVASEVRALAHRSSAAAKEIKALISASALHVGRGVDQVGRAGEALQSIVGSVGNVAALVSNIAAGAAEQSTGLGEINIGVTQLDQVTQQNAAMVEQSTAASHLLQQDATGLSDLVARFRLPGTAESGLGEGAAAPAEIALSKFRPRGFASSETLAAETLTEARLKPQRAAAGGQAIWKDF